MRFLKALRMWLPRCNVNNAPEYNISLITRVSSHSSGDFAQKFTLVPFHRAVARNGWDIPHDHHRYRLDVYLSRGEPKRYALCCDECINQDLSRWGFSYWHRSVQINGFERCPKHPESTLLRVPVDNEWFTPPHRCHNKVPVIAHSVDSTDAQQLVIQRYQDICLGLLEMRQPLSYWNARALLTVLASPSDKDIGPLELSRLLESQLEAKLSCNWRRIYFPKAGYTIRFDHQPPPSSHFALAMAVLNNTADEALKKWKSAIHCQTADSNPLGPTVPDWRQ